MKPILVHVQIYAVSEPQLDEADVVFVKQFEIENFKIPLPDVIYELCCDATEVEHPNCEYVDFEVLDYSLGRN